MVPGWPRALACSDRRPVNAGRRISYNRPGRRPSPARRQISQSDSLRPFPHNAPRPRARSAPAGAPWRRLPLLLCLALALAAPGRAFAAFEVVSGSTAITPDAIVTRAELDLELNDTVVEAIDKGIELRIVAELRLLRVRPWIWDDVIGEWRTGYRLKYHDLSSTYVLTDEASGELETFTTIRDAMDSLADLTLSLPVLTETLPDNPPGFRAQLRVDIDRESLPPPLKLITEISPAWQIGSKWSQWTVAR